MKCPICEKGELKKEEKSQNMYGVNLGKFPALVCKECNESYTTEDTTKQIEIAAKEKGIWGMGKKTKLIKSGNSLAIRIPKEIADYLKIKEGDEAFIHPDEKGILIET
ncbi:MAG: AbrB/MazE/SpoVT family DNA-binding domain-containing protein [archaeon]